MKLAPPIRRDLTQMVVGLAGFLGNAADQVGRAADYVKGMGDYATGAKYQGWLDTAKDLLLKKALPAAVGGGAGAEGINMLRQFMQKNQ